VNERAKKLLDETAAARNEVLSLATSLTAEQLDRPTTNEGWSIKDILAHLASTEARQRLIVRTVLDGGTWVAGEEDRDDYNARAVAERRTWTPDAIITELRETGRETASLVERLAVEELDREWDHPIFGRMTIERTAQITARHLQRHAEEIRMALQS
jgi:uncharacterized protein (TIGR03083 family)